MIRNADWRSAAAVDVDGLVAELTQLLARYDALEQVARGAPSRSRHRRDQLRAVAERFPAARRELAAVGRDGVCARRAAIVDLIRDVRATGSGVPLDAPEHRWVRAALALTPRLRLVLAIKRWLATHAPSGGLAAADTRARVRACYPDADDDLLDRIASPPNGRLQQIAYRDAARALGTSVDEVKRALYGE